MKIIIFVTLLANSLLITSAQTAGDEHSQSPIRNNELSYVRIIYNDSSETYFRNSECPDGIWREKVIANPNPSCICVKGVYAVSSGLCDENFHIITGNEHCYSLDKLKVRKIFPLIDKMGFKGRATTVFRQDGPYFARLVSVSPKNYVPEGGKYVFRMNDPTVLSAFQTDGDMSFGLKCLQGQNIGSKSAEDLENNPVMQIAMLPQCANEFWGDQSWCSTAGNFDYSWTIKLGSSWSQTTKSSKSGMKFNKKCNGAPSLDPPPANYDNLNMLKSMPSCDKVSTQYPRSKDPQPNPFAFDATNITLPSTLKANWHTESEHQITANEITRKVAKDLVAFALSGKKLPGINSTEYKMLQQSKVIFLKVCPQEDIPIAAINYLIRAFRLVYLESQKIYSHNPIRDTVLEQSINEALTQCEATAQYIKFHQGNCSKFPENIESKTGENGAAVNLSLYYNNRTDQNLTLPQNILFEASRLSYPIELAWKLVAHSHYFCASSFKTGYEHSAFQARMEEMLTSPPILYQWKHPGASLQVYQVLMSRFDLVDIAKKIDRCVAYAQSISPYKEWLHRPADFIASVPKSRKKRYHFSNNFWDHKAYCLANSEEIRTHVTTYHEGLCGKTPVYYQNSNA